MGPNPREGELVFLTLAADGSYDRGFCRGTPCTEPDHETGIYSLSRSRTTRTWAIIFSSQAVAGLSNEGLVDRFDYRRSKGALELQREGTSHPFDMQKLDDSAAPTPGDITEEELAKIKGLYRRVGKTLSLGDFELLDIDEKATFRRQICLQLRCEIGNLITQEGTLTFAAGTTSGLLYLDFSVRNESGAIVVEDRYAYESTGSFLTLRLRDTARAFDMAR